ncbi:hypothetical protein JF781_17395 [Mycobacterium sp. WUMAC-067]|nr:hypothetical protein [Mycobacterium sp. WUMAC-067]MCA2315256.1 hypothetical protein [Mycobacterium sp. WUMAC-025]
MYAQPLRETRVELHVVYFAVHLPLASGLTLRVPLLTMIKPLPSNEKSEEPSRVDGQRAHR